MLSQGDSPLGESTFDETAEAELGDYSDMQRRGDDALISGRGGGVRCEKRQGDELILLGLVGSIWVCKWETDAILL